VKLDFKASLAPVLGGEGLPVPRPERAQLCRRPWSLVSASFQLAALGWLVAWGGRVGAQSPAALENVRPAISFTRQVAPLLGRYCTDCHGGDKPRAGIALDRYQDDAAAANDHATWEKVQKALHEGAMPPAKKKQPTPAERGLLEAFLDQQLALGAAKRGPGAVTLRRLNRTEYNNTIRDLVGLSFHPADDFPADDVGYGFDNIGDVLSVSPVLLERYLVAAERIVGEALREPSSSSRRFLAAEMHPSPKPEDLVDGFRRLAIGGQVDSGPFDVRGAGDYILRLRAYGAEGPSSLRLVLRLDSKDIRGFDVRVTQARPQAYEARARLDAGSHTVAIVHDGKNTDPKQTGRDLFVQVVEVEGPIGRETEAPLEPPVTPGVFQRLMICRPGPQLSQDDCARKILGAFARRAYRRPVAAEEIERLVGLVRRCEQNGESFDKGIRLALEAVLVSPNFLFRIERDPDSASAGTPHPISEYELATRLSYFLWSSMPDEELFTLADRGALRQNLEAQVRRMLHDGKARALAENFAPQWLETRNLRALTPDRSLFPRFNDGLRAAMMREVELFFGAIVDEDRPILDLLDADFTFVNEPLAAHYGIRDVKGPELRRVRLEDGQRGGVLTLGAVLTVTSNPTRTSPVKRGKWILENLFNAPPPPPPPNAGELKEEKGAVQLASLRQRMELHRSKPECAGCHARLDPLGFGLENFDAIGAWRTRDGKLPVDPSGTLPGGETFQGPAELKKILRDRSEAFGRCLAEKLLTYALGRGLEATDRRAVDEMVQALARDRYRFSTLVLELVKSEPFQLRRGRRD
jgi:hypothetical protein